MVHTPYDLGVGLEIGDGKDTPAHFRSMWYGDGGKLISVFHLSKAEPPYLVVEFNLPEICRLLDEFWPSTETHPDWEGDLSHFCRTVEGALYPTDLEWVRMTRPKAQLYQFVTNDECLEVVTEHPPTAWLADASELPTYNILKVD